MSHYDRALRSQFFLTSPRPCPYLPGRKERKLFTNLAGASAAALHDELAQHGFRRSQNIAYRPACAGCDACVSTRVRAREFAPTAAQTRAAKRNADLRRSVGAAEPTEEQYALFRRYLEARHADGGMTDMEAADFAAMVEDTSVRTRIIEYRLPPEDAAETGARGPARPGRLVAACLTDVLADGLSMVYSFFDPDLTARSLGVFTILDHVALARATDLDYVYLGYWVAGSPKMDYKKNYAPAEILSDRGWVLLEQG